MSTGWHPKNIYLYLVSFVTLMMIIFGLVAFLNNLTRLVVPTEYLHYPTLMEIEQEFIVSKQEVPPVAELERIRDNRISLDKARGRAYRMRDLIGTLAVWLIPIPFYLYHWRKIKQDLFAAGEEKI
ncbi:MAG: hypothetical protein KGZ79_00740 [Dethiobacter sp.]|jgi:hypothetical protein|nr:hypothetical protein [Dethiobacter sp.]